VTPPVAGFHTVVARRIDPAMAEVVERPYGMTVGEIVEQEFPGATPEQRARLVIVLVLEREERELALELHAAYRPPAGSTVRFHVRIGKGNLVRTLLSVAILVFAAWAGPALLPGILGTMLTGAIAFAGTQLLNALIPIEGPKQGERPDPRYSIQGSRNRMVPYGKVPDNFGDIRIYPPHAAQPWVEGVREDRYTRFLFLLGYAGPDYDRWRIGGTALEEFKDYELEIYTIVPGEPWPVAGYQNPVFEIAPDILLKQENGWEVRDFPTNCDLLAVEAVCKQGLYRTNSKGHDRPWKIQVAVEYKLKSSPDWIPVKVLEAEEETQSEFWFSYQWLAPAVGNYQARMRRVTMDTTGSGYVDKVHWGVLRGFRPVRPIKFNKAVDVAYLRIRAQEQAAGMLDQISCVAHARLPDWDEASGTWITRRTNSPAAAMRRIAEGPANPDPTPLEEVDLLAFQALAEHARAKGMTFNMTMDQKISVDEALRMAGRAGRAYPTRPEGMRSCIIDRPQTVKRGVISARNATNFSGEPVFADRVDAFRVSFLDEDDDFKQTERIVLRPGLVGAPKTYMALDLPGFTNATMIYRECIRRFAELELRFETLTAEQGALGLFCPPGGLIGAQFVTVDKRQAAGRVLQVEGDLVVLDETVEMIAGESYACQFQTPGPSDDEPVKVFVRQVAGALGGTQMLQLVGDGEIPKAGDVALFGLADFEAEDVIVKEIEPLKGQRARLTMVAHAPEIEERAMAAVPEWFPITPIAREWEEVAPAKPVIESVTSGGPRVDPVDFDPATDPETPGIPPPVVVVVRAGAGSPAPTDRIVVTATHGGDEETQEVTAGYGSAKFRTFEAGDALTITAIAYSLFDVASDESDPVEHTVQETSEVAPEVTGFTASVLADGKIRYAWTSDDVTSRARIRYGAPGAVYPDMTPAHDGYATASPVNVPTPAAAGSYRVGIVLQNEETGLESDPAYANLVIDGPATPAAFTATLDLATIKYSAKAAEADERTYRLQFRRGSILQAVGQASAVYTSRADAGDVRTFSESPGPGIHRCWATALDRSGGYAATPAGPIDVLIAGETHADDFNRADGPVGSPWTAAAGVTVSANKMAFGAGTNLAWIDVGCTRQYFRFTVAATLTTAGAGSFLGAVRVVDATNLIGVRYSGNKWTIVRIVGGAVVASWDSATIAPPTADVTICELQIDESHAVLFMVDGVVVIASTASGASGAMATSTKVGVEGRAALNPAIENVSCGVQP
jgi:hypothetical protein